MNILVINAGSSSLKYQLIDMDNEALLAKGLVERIGFTGFDSDNFSQKVGDKKVSLHKELKNHKEAFELVIKELTDPEMGAIKDMSSIGAVGHRVLHGGADFTQSVLIADDVLKAIEDNIPLGPLHNPANLTGILACREIMPDVPMVAVFDTAFHQTMPRRAYLYGIDYKYYETLKIRRYGFHGTSHRFVSAEVAKMLGRNDLKMVICHLGNGSSMSAVVNGKCIDTSMGLTPLEGLLMGTRSGDLDPAVIGFVAEREGKSASEMITMLNKSSGFIGLSGGLSNDWRDIIAAAKAGDERGKRTAEVWSYRIRKYIGAYAAAMNGLDVVVFTAGIGENSSDARRLALEDTQWLGIELDEKRNAANETVISTDNSKVKVLVVPTNEELAIARDTLEIVSALK
ncbi:MAG TPA: acetate kinase [Candidatus Aphodomonas merdavium]|nr:acetate kinase [Candidatus Aphodomonas merdavium]